MPPKKRAPTPLVKPNGDAAPEIAPSAAKKNKKNESENLQKVPVDGNGKGKIIEEVSHESDDRNGDVLEALSEKGRSTDKPNEDAVTTQGDVVEAPSEKGRSNRKPNQDAAATQGAVAEPPSQKGRSNKKQKDTLTIPEKSKINRKRGTQLPSADYQSDEEKLEVPKKKGKAKTDELPPKKMSEGEVDGARSKRGGAKKMTKVNFEEATKPEKKVTLPSRRENATDLTEEIPMKKTKGAAKKGKLAGKKGKSTDDNEPVDKEEKDSDNKGKKGKAPKKEKLPVEGEVEKKVKVSKKAKVTKKKTKTKEEVSEVSSTSETNLPKNQTSTDWEDLTFDCKKKNAEGNLPNIKITSWNVDGLRSWLKKNGLNIIKYASPDVLCLQETKCADNNLPEEITGLEEYHKFWCASEKSGYAGVGLLSKVEPLDVSYGIGNDDLDDEGRCITAEFESFFVVSVYVPNAGRKLVTLDKRLEWNDAFKEFIKDLDKMKPVIICGDLNVAHSEIDLKNPKTNTKNAGFTKEERDGMTDFLRDAGFIDTFRALYPDEKDVYTFWTYMMNARKKNIGWRLDYFLISERLKDKFCDNIVHDKIFGSDHCPITLFINI